MGPLESTKMTELIPTERIIPNELCVAVKQCPKRSLYEADWSEQREKREWHTKRIILSKGIKIKHPWLRRLCT